MMLLYPRHISLWRKGTNDVNYLKLVINFYFNNEP